MKKFIFNHKNNQYFFNGDSIELFKIKDTSQISKIDFETPKEIDSHRANGFKTLTLVLTNNCNLKCSYCYANKGAYNKKGFVMSSETGKKSIDLLLESILNQNLSEGEITFFGGEPLLEKNLLINLLEYSSNKFISNNKKIKYTIITNGTLLDLEIIQLIKKYKISVIVSLDGDENIHNKNRITLDGKGSFNKIISNIEILKKNKIEPIIRITFSDGNEDSLNVIKSLHEKYNLNLFSYDYDSNMSDKSFKCFLESLDSLYEYYFEKIKGEDYFNIFEITNNIGFILNRLRKNFHCSCGVAYLTVSADGFVYQCQRFIGKEKYVEKDIQNLKLDDLNKQKNCYKNNLLIPSNCQQCEFQYACGGTCFHNRKENFQVNNRDCVYKKNDIINSLRFLTELYSDENIFRKYIHFLKGGEIQNEL